MDSEGCILVAEDDDPIRAFLVMALAHEGYGVVAARSGAETLQRLRVHRPRLLVMDYDLGDLTAAQVVAKYRQMPPPHSPILLVTASQDPEQLADEVGAQAVLAKPVELDQLLGAVGKLTD
jgi:two-component system response regulator MprA